MFDTKAKLRMENFLVGYCVCGLCMFIWWTGSVSLYVCQCACVCRGGEGSRNVYQMWLCSVMTGHIKATCWLSVDLEGHRGR